MKKSKLGFVDPSQKRITSFFKRTTNPVADDRKLSETARKRRKTSSLLKPRNSAEPVPVVDLLDSDDGDVDYLQSFEPVARPAVSSGGPSSTNIQDEEEASASSTSSASSGRIPVFITKFEKKEEEKPVDAVVVTTEETVTQIKTVVTGYGEEEDESDVFESSFVTQRVDVQGIGSDDDEENDGCIRLRNFNSILETTQSSQGSQGSCHTIDLSCENSETEVSSKSCQSPVKLELATCSDRKALLSPPMQRKAEASTSSSSSKKSSDKKTTPAKTPKTKLAYFSAVRQLQIKSRSSSKTPTKTGVKTPSKINPSPMKSPGKNPQMNSPLKALWDQQRHPYYLKNFLLILDSVVNDPYNSHLLNEEDTEIIQKFRSLSYKAKCLFVRLAGRTWKWLKPSAMNYKEIGLDLTDVFDELHRKGFVIAIKEDKLQLEDLLNLLSHDRLPEICKQMNIKVTGKMKNKESCIEAIMNTAQRQSTLKGSMTDILYKKALEEVGPAYKLCAEPRCLFSRIFIMYQPPQYWEQESDKDKLQLLSILLAETNKVEYPSYKVNKTQRIYKDRDAVIAFQEAWRLLSQIEGFSESKKWDCVTEIAETAMQKFRSHLLDDEVVEADKKLPQFLRAYVAGTILAKICWAGVEGFQKQKNYQLAIDYLNFLLSQSVYLVHYFGRWYDRLVLNSTHLKVPSEEIKRLIERALADSNVRDNYKHDLHERLKKLNLRESKKKKKPKRKGKRKRGKKKDDEDEDESEDDEVSEDEVVDVDPEGPPGSYHIRHALRETTIVGEKMSTFDREYGKSVFLGEHSDGGSHQLSSVEQFALNHYRKEGYTEGVHAEGSVPTTLYGLLFWSVIYNDEIPDTFHSPYQAFPLDLHFDDFFIRRQNIIEDLLQKLRSQWTLDDALEEMQKNWTDNLNKLSIVNWGLFSDFSHLETLVRSMGLPLIAGICERLARNYRYYHSGFPDLIVWNGTKCRIAEVKGPGDKLSAKQRLWIDHLMDLNADVEVCLVKSVSNKRLRRS